ncbi:thioredoxin domain-containing protein [Costertonia aggregata]|uniref:Thioredoxin domain-containing protein n=1 Tax=Costertonia aggregata TaxID=343403 RepID=A0A7H9AUL1_9FLAO|nr:thioredoxin domain-containing protein [Costertonia aggregata]
MFRALGLGFTMLLFFSTCKKNDKKQMDIDHKYTNALIDETSPYLLQHAHNPVDWRPWSQEALDEAKKENKLVLVSIGYSSCHWCHVMEEETFENDTIAELMNENFINIKVDREERPDVDQIYMTAVQLMQGDGGWPLNVITLPNGKPLYGGTYHTKEQWQKVLTKISKLYNENPIKAEEYSDMVAKGIQEVNIIQPSADFERLTKDALAQSVETWKSSWDTTWGGDKRNEKFMLPVNLDFLLDYALLSRDEAVLAHVELTLDKMVMGGVYDHIGGGFFRYSTDPEWKVPHFEKMLYDNAQLIYLYAKAYKTFKKETYKEVVLGTIAFLEREMKNPEGGYFAALDADIEGEEGKYYVWTKDELKSVLGGDFPLFASYYTIAKDAVWEDGKYVLHKLNNDTSFTSEHHITLNELRSKQKIWREKLGNAKQKRVRPRTDDKIITSWNALLIKGYVEAYTALGNETYLNNALSILTFIESKSYVNEKLGHSHKKDSKFINGFLEDYSFLADACITLYSVSMNEKHLEFAKKLTQTIAKNFTDEASGLYTYNEGEELISKLIKTDDGVIPSPNSVMAKNLFKLGHINYDMHQIKKAKTMLSTVLPNLQENPYAYANWNSLFLNTTYPYYEVAIVGNEAASKLKELGRNNIPNTLKVGSTKESDLPLFQDRYDESDTYIYVCRDNTCKLPVTDVKEAMGLLPKSYVQKNVPLHFDTMN